jgi:hypothetical protein
VGLTNLGSESKTCVGSRVHLVGVSISFEKNFYRLPFTPPLSGSPYRSFNTPIQNNVVERKNKTLCEMDWTMLDEHRTPRRFWTKAVNTACYVSNRIYLRVHKNKTCYELMHGCTPKVSHFHVFGCKCFILKKGKNLDKFEASSVDGIFFGYASHSRAYRVLNLETNQIVETCEVTFDKTQPRSQLILECAGDDELGEEIFQEE